uniref:Histone RNA hairpin-binding protein RNA-binding domain-containing protein n=1 Tax=Eutreptiella gymnastica TaxID=73025 RepID=A0A7S4GC65_9EUGL|mmetsp:Transcript_27964/g.44865  ORF Transcript_27964/g.44865 Transcript_27964/m.44865 type:complete len:416 (+) Transcript_27964:23-1270(+)
MSTSTWLERGQAPPRQQSKRASSSRHAIRKKKEREQDEHKLEQRKKQIAYGEITRGYINFMKMSQRDPSLLKGCVPVKPVINQKCSKRSWDGQLKKWRRALHMYDYVDFDESEEQSKEVREALVEQTINPVFSPAKDPSLMPKFDLFSPLRGAAWADELDSPGPFAPSPSVKNTCDSSPEKGPITPIRLSVTKTCALSVNSGPKVPVSHPVRYSFDDLLSLMDAPLVQESVRLPDTLSWLDKRIDLEDDVDDDYEPPSVDLRSPVAQRFLGSPYDQVPATPTRLFQGGEKESGKAYSPSPRKPWALHWADDDTYDSQTGMSLDRRVAPPVCARKISLTTSTTSTASMEPQVPGDRRHQQRTPLRPIPSAITRAATSVKKGRSELWMDRCWEEEKENFPPSLGSCFCTPPRRPHKG